MQDRGLKILLAWSFSPGTDIRAKPSQINGCPITFPLFAKCPLNLTQVSEKNKTHSVNLQ
jgi:hypothetical protein